MLIDILPASHRSIHLARRIIDLDVSQILHQRLLIPSYFVSPVIVEAAETEDDLIHLRVRTDSGRLEEITLTVEEIEQVLAESRIEETHTASPDDQFLLIETERIRLAYAHDPYFAVSLSGVEPLPHQLEAVYERMLPQARLRFLLADDPGAGKTIMAGLLIKELKMRAAIERVLVLCPAPLTIQWQDEMRSKFDEIFEIVRADLAKDQLAGNVWERFPQCIASIDFAKQDDVAPELLRADWDLVIIDEAHKCAARWFSGEVKKTRRYNLAEVLGERAERLLLLTATPHCGDPEQFAYFLRLLDPDQFIGPDRVENFSELNQRALMPRSGTERSPWFLRRMKEELRDFEGRKLFTQRHPITVLFELSPEEMRLYEAVTQYINTYLPRQTGRRKAPVALARMVLQRRLASSVRAIHRSLQRRHDRFRAILDEVQSLPQVSQEKYLRGLNLLETFDEEQDTDDADDLTNDYAATNITAAERIGDLVAEVAVLDKLVKQAHQLEAVGDERKLQALMKCLERAEFAELQDGRGKLLIFTEHRDTLDYLRERLEGKYIVTEIHGGMNARARKEAQEDFRLEKQICLATDAAGEGINLQFCHLMINYDIPWSPVRLEQRMGRIHRIGQRLDVYIFNFVTGDTVEGRILRCLLEKLERMRTALGDRVFDVIQTVLRVNDIDLEAILREAAHHPRDIDDEFYLDQIEQIDPARLRDLEQATGVAMATSHVDLSWVQAQDFRSEERRLMPEYVERYFLASADKVGLRVEQRADTLYRVEHVPLKLRATNLVSVRRFGPPDMSYTKLTFNKQDILTQSQHANAELLSPGHPLFAAVSETLENQLNALRGATAVYYDEQMPDPYFLHFFVVELVGEEPSAGGYKTITQYARLLALLETQDGNLEAAPADILHNLAPAEGETPARPLDPETRQHLEKHIRGRLQRVILDEQRGEREREIEIRRDYLNDTFQALINAMQRRYYDLADKVNSGQSTHRIARDEAARRVEELEARWQQKLKDLNHLRVLRPGPIRYLGSAEVYPLPIDSVDSASYDAMHSDPAVERRAMEFVMAYERERGWVPTDVSHNYDGSGFDIRSLGPTDVAEGYRQRPVRRIEVKGRSGTNRPVALTPNEWIQAGRHGDSYWLYVVWGAGEGQEPQLLPIQNPSRVLAQYAQPVIKHYLVSAEAISQNAQVSG